MMCPLVACSRNAHANLQIRQHIKSNMPARPLCQPTSCSGQARGTSEDSTTTRRAWLCSQTAAVCLLLASPSQASPENFGRGPPENYVTFAKRLLTALRDSIEADLSPANETEVRRKADPAKVLVKEWVSNWRDARSVSSEASYKNITESLQLLGDFYLKKGQRARLPPELGSRILRRLDSASAALPA